MTSTLQAPAGATVVLPPHGFIHLRAVSASDLDVVNDARVSLGKQTQWEDDFDDEPQSWAEDGYGGHWAVCLADEDEGVLRFLMKNKHGTPFEQNFFKWHIRAPLFVFREWHRHRIGWSYNEESGRYTQLQPDFYIPKSEDWRTQVGKPGRYTFEPMGHEDANHGQKTLYGQYRQAYAAYEDQLAHGVAKEVARLVLPVGIYSQMIATCNARSLMNFLTLRNALGAMKEIRMYAEAMEALFAEVMPVTHAAYLDAGRVAP